MQNKFALIIYYIYNYAKHCCTIQVLSQKILLIHKEEILLIDTNKDLALFYSFAVEQAAIGIHAINHKGRTIIYNKKMKDIEGLALEDVQDRSILELFSFEQEESTLLKVLQSGKALLNVKQTYWNRNGIEITTINDTYPVFKLNELIGAVEISSDVTALEKFNKLSTKKMINVISSNQITAHSNAMKTVLSTAKKASLAHLSVLLIGETGTGKSLIARSIHDESASSHKPFFTFRCHGSDSISFKNFMNELNETEHYTLFFERIDLLPIPLQVQMLESLSNPVNQNCQFIASINDDPVSLIASGTLLKELYYFFASFPIQIPPLRKRQEDIVPYVTSYLTEQRERFNSPLKEISSEVQELFLTYDWPGNIRELELLLNEITSLASTETIITYEMLPLHFRIKIDHATTNSKGPEDFILNRDKTLLPLDAYLHEAEIYYLEKAMKLHNGNVTKTAHALGMSRQSLQYRLRKIKSKE